MKGGYFWNSPAAVEKCLHREEHRNISLPFLGLRPPPVQKILKSEVLLNWRRNEVNKSQELDSPVVEVCAPLSMACATMRSRNPTHRKEFANWEGSIGNTDIADRVMSVRMNTPRSGEF